MAESSNFCFKHPNIRTVRTSSCYTLLEKQPVSFCKLTRISVRVESAEGSIPASRSEPRLARSYTKMWTNTGGRFDGKHHLQSFSPPHSPLKWPLRPWVCCARPGDAHAAQNSRFLHGSSVFSLPSDPDSSFWAAFCLRAASTAYFLPLLAELKRSSASSLERRSNPDQDPNPDRFTAVPPLHLPGRNRGRCLTEGRRGVSSGGAAALVFISGPCFWGHRHLLRWITRSTFIKSEFCCEILFLCNKNVIFDVSSSLFFE